MEYLLRRAKVRPELEGRWDGVAWTEAESLDISVFRPESSDHRPRTRAKLLYDDEGLYGLFHVQDKYVRCIHTNHSTILSVFCFLLARSFMPAWRL